MNKKIIISIEHEELSNFISVRETTQMALLQEKIGIHDRLVLKNVVLTPSFTGKQIAHSFVVNFVLSFIGAGGDVLLRLAK